MIFWDNRSDCPVCLCPDARVLEREGEDTWRTCIVCGRYWAGDRETAVKYGL